MHVGDPCSVALQGQASHSLRMSQLCDRILLFIQNQEPRVPLVYPNTWRLGVRIYPGPWPGCSEDLLLRSKADWPDCGAVTMEPESKHTNISKIYVSTAQWEKVGV